MSEKADRLEAEDAVFDRIKELSKDADADGLLKLGQSFMHVVHGPQGGWIDYRYNSKTDNHETKHDGEQRERPTGFTAD